MIGFRVRTHVSRPDASQIKRFAALPSADISDAMRGSGTMRREIRAMYSPMPRIAGPAVTVSIPSASMGILKAGFQQAGPGDIVVVNGQANMTSAFVGSNMLRGLLHRGVAGFILDGALRDVCEIRADGLPVFARGITTAAGPDGPDAGEVNFPIACGGVVVNPGDIVVADEDGIVVVPPADVDEVLAATTALQAKHEAIQDLLKRGEIVNITAIEQSLRAAGCVFID